MSEVAKMSEVHIPEQRLSELKETFALFVTENEEFMDVTNFPAAVRCLGLTLTEAEVYDLVSPLPLENGAIDFDQFAQTLIGPLKQIEAAENYEEIFKIMNFTGSGVIRSEEVERIMDYLGEKFTAKEVDQMIKEADLNGDLGVDYDEFIYLTK